MALFYKQNGSFIVVQGNTFPYKEAIKTLGGRFNGSDKSWRLPADPSIIEQIDALCRNSGGGKVPDPETALNSDCDPPLQGLNPKTQAPATGAKKSPAHSIDQQIAGNLLSPEQPPKTTLGMPRRTRDITIAELVESIASTIMQKYRAPIWVIAELENISARQSGYFLNLAQPKDEIGTSTSYRKSSGTLSMNGILWSNTAGELRQKLGSKLFNDIFQEGIKVRALCQVNFYRDRGQVSLNILNIDPNYTMGNLALKREQVLAALKAKGIDQLNKNLRRPRFPLRIGLISAEDSRAKSDFLHQLEAGGYNGEVLFHEASMQGEKTVATVITALKALEKRSCDLIVVTRGGGSAADLRWFDDEKIAAAMCQAKTPIIAAIGHHDDTCVVEQIANLREKTPTAAAEAILKMLSETYQSIDDAALTLAQLLNTRFSQTRQQFLQLAHRLRVASDQYFAAEHNQLYRSMLKLVDGVKKPVKILSSKLMSGAYRLHQSSKDWLAKACQNLNRFETTFDKHDPRSLLESGWTQLSQNQRSVKNVSEIDQTLPVRARLIDGELELQVSKIYPRQQKKES